MKVLFIGEGPTDIGHSGMDPDRPRPATGPLAILARKVCPQIDADSLALRWVEIARFDPRGKKKGWEAKVAAAILLSARKFDCDGTICIADRDRQKERLSEMDAGLQRGLGQVGSEHAAVCGVAIESIEAWALGAPSALAAELEEEVKTIQREYRLKEVEQFCESSGKEEHRPKGLLERKTARTVSSHSRMLCGRRLRVRHCQVDVSLCRRRGVHGAGARSSSPFSLSSRRTSSSCSSSGRLLSSSTIRPIRVP